jgi:hypothetical protein
VWIVRECEALKRHLDQLKRADEQNEAVIDASAVEEVHPETGKSRFSD